MILSWHKGYRLLRCHFQASTLDEKRERRALPKLAFL
jgi:hypothetical protein